MSRSWSEWLGVDAASRAAAAAARAKAAAERQDAAVVELRRLFDSDEGRACAAQLAQGGEFGRAGRAEDALTDAYLRRWLVARDWNVEVTYKLLVDHGAWRERNTPRGFIEEERILRPLEDDKTFLQGVDYEGRAIVIVRVANHFSSKRDLRQMRLFSAYIIDCLVSLCDKERNPQQRVVCMFDMTDCSMANMDVPCMKSILGLLSTHYVERLSAMYFFNPPRIFFGLWNASKHLVHEVTRQKIKMIDPSDLADLQACVPPEVLPVKYGGAAPLRPIAEACRHFLLPPFDGRVPVEAPIGAPLPGSEAAEAGAEAGAAASSSSASDGEPVDARLVVADAEDGAGAKAASEQFVSPLASPRAVEA